MRIVEDLSVFWQELKLVNWFLYIKCLKLVNWFLYIKCRGGLIMFDRKQRRKYAEGMKRIELGIWGHKKSLFRAIHLTTRLGDDNSVDRFKKDFKLLMKWFRGLGYDIEYCAGLGYTPNNYLLHLHGLLRVKGGYLPVSRRQLGDKWNEIHGAFVVKMEKVRRYSDFGKYIQQHIMKDYADAGMARTHFMVSSGWRKHGCENVIEEVKQWYLEGKGIPWLDSSGWRIVNKVMQAYCEGKNMLIRASFGHCLVFRGKVKVAEIYGSEVN